MNIHSFCIVEKRTILFRKCRLRLLVCFLVKRILWHACGILLYLARRESVALFSITQLSVARTVACFLSEYMTAGWSLTETGDFFRLREKQRQGETEIDNERYRDKQRERDRERETQGET